MCQHHAYIHTEAIWNDGQSVQPLQITKNIQQEHKDMARRTYEGRTGRVVGFVTGTVFMIPGIVVSTIAIVRGNLVSKDLQETIVNLAPWLSTPAGPELATGGLVFGLAFGGFFLFFGLYHVVRVFVVDDYSITVGSRHP